MIDILKNALSQKRKNFRKIVSGRPEAMENLFDRGLIFPPELVILRAMVRLAVVLIGIIWASLLLFSWSGPADGQHLSPRSEKFLQNRH